MAFEIHNPFAVGVALFIAELLFWLLVGFGLIKYKKKSKKKWKSPFKSPK
tara:strand:+ start:4175 stop:4324 length:150 start_codon:yes stop_codon:yes gene_type:complete